MFKKKICMVVSVLMLFVMGVTSAWAVTSGDPGISASGEDITPYYIYIRNPSVSLSNEGSYLDCFASVSVASGHCSRIDLDLQRYGSNGWETIKTWSQFTPDIYTRIDETYSPAHGYTYRLKGNYYSSQGDTRTDSTVLYSREVSY